MYIVDIFVKMCWVAGYHIWEKCKFVYTRFGIYPIRSCHAVEVLPLPRFYQILSWKKKEKFLYKV